MAEWKKVIVSGSDAELNSLAVGSNQDVTTNPATTKLSGSFSGSFQGDGSALTGIIATSLDIDAFGSDLTGITVADTDKLILSDAGTEGRVNASQLATYVFNKASDAGDASIGSDGSITINANCVTLGTDTNGNYVGTITGGTGIASTGATTGEGIAHTLSLDFSELTDMTGDISGTTEFILQNGTTESRKAASEIKLSNFNNDSGWTSCLGDITGVTAGAGILGGGASGTVTVSVDSGSMLPYYSGSIFGTVSGDVTIAANGVATIGNDAVALGTNTTGNYVATITGGTGIDSSGGTSGEGIAHTLSVNLGELSAGTIVSASGVSAAGDTVNTALSNINISSFNNNSGFTACTGTVTSVTVTAGSGLTGGGTITTSGTATLNVGAGTGIDVAADAISVDVSDFMTNGANNRIVTATGTDAMNAEANLTFDGSTLTVTGDATITGTLTAQEFKTELVSASIIYESGSTKFGDTADDVHSFTGSLRVQGSLSGSMSGSFEGDGSGLTGITATSLDIDTFGSDLTGVTIADTDKLILSDAGTEGRINASQIATYVFNKASDAGDATIGSDGGITINATSVEGTMLNSNVADGTTITLSSNTLSTLKVPNVLTAGTGITSTGTFDGSAARSFNLALSEVSAGTIVSASGVSAAGDTVNTALSAINLSSFNNDAGFTTCTGDITGVTAGNGLTGGGSSGAVTLDIGAGTGIDVAADAISVDVSDFMTNGADNRIVTATGTDAMNAEANLTFDGTFLKLVGSGSFGATDNIVTGQCAFAFGEANTAAGIYSTVLAGCNNYAGNCANVVAGGNNCAYAEADSVLGGSQNCASGSQWCIPGHSAIVAGARNTGSGGYGFIGAGRSNSQASIMGSIVAGCLNCIGASTVLYAPGYNFIGAGCINTITSGRDNSSIVGGRGNCIAQDCNFIGGGQDNILTANSLSSIVGGFANCNTSLAGFIGGGSRNTGSGNYGVIGGGEKNSVSGTCSGILGGNDNTVTHNDSFIVGSDLSSKAACHTFVNNLDVTSNACITGSLTVNTNLTVNGNTVIGNAATDTVTINADIASCLVPSTTTLDLGTASDQWRNLYIDGTANIDCLSADSADINAGTIDNTVIGGSTCAAGTFTTLNATSLVTTGNATVGGNLTVNGDLSYLNVTNLAVEDRFILLNSGALGTVTKEGGLVIDGGGGVGPAYFYDQGSARWAFTGSFNAATTGSGGDGLEPDAYVAAVVTSDIAEYQKTGNIRVEGGEVYIYV